MENPIVEYIRQERRRRLWSVRKLAKEAHLSPGYVSQIENGKRPLTPRATGQIADAFRMPPHELLTRAGFIPADHLEAAQDNARRALSEIPGIAQAARGATDDERLEWLVVDYLYLLGHDPYGTGWDGTPGHHADWRLLDPDAPPPIMERLQPEIDAWMAEQREQAQQSIEGWDRLMPEEKRLVQELVNSLIKRRTTGR